MIVGVYVSSCFWYWFTGLSWIKGL